jgi:hypothetical protein
MRTGSLGLIDVVLGAMAEEAGEVVVVRLQEPLELVAPPSASVIWAESVGLTIMQLAAPVADVPGPWANCVIVHNPKAPQILSCD